MLRRELFLSLTASLFLAAASCGGQVASEDPLADELTVAQPQLVAKSLFMSDMGPRPKSDGSYIYYLSDLKTISRIPIAGGAPQTIFATGSYTINDFTIDDVYAYLALGNGTNGGVRRISKTGCCNTLLRLTDNPVIAIRVDRSSIYYANWIPGTQKRGSIVWMAPDGSSISVLAKNQDVSGIDEGAFAMDENALYWPDGSTLRRIWKTGAGGVAVIYQSVQLIPINGVAVSLGTLYFTEGSAMRRMPADGGPAISVSVGPYQLWDITVGRTNLFVNDVYSLLTASKSGGAPARISLAPARGVTASTEGVYFLEHGNLWRYPN